MAAETVFFETAQAMRAWLRRHHATATELIVGYYKVQTFRNGRRSVTWPESVAEALCFGWIDGIRRRLDAERYTIRFTPRRPGSRWSALNIRLVRRLEDTGRMTEAGRTVFRNRKDQGGAGYEAQKKNGALDRARLKRFKESKEAWAFFEAQPPGYRRRLSWWVMQAKRDETRDRRLQKLIDVSARGRRIE
jgi:uncharacterized protein YdeI (YjbR/CyaY-like superfamily)